MSKLLDSAAIKALRDNEFELHSLDVRLERQSPSDPHCLAGPGVIRQDTSGRLLLTLYAVNQLDIDQMFKTWPIGRVIPDDAYYSLTASDEMGQVWTSSGLQPHQQASVVSKGAVVSAQLPYLTTQLDHSANRLRSPESIARLMGKRSLEFFVFSELEVPVNEKTVTTTHGGGNKTELHTRNIARFTACNRQFVVTRSQEMTRVQVLASEQPFSRDFEYHVADSLEFILLAPVTPHVVITRDQTVEVVRIHGLTERDRWRSMLPPPFAAMSETAFDDAWRMFDCYLRYVTATGGQSPHRLSAQWRGVLRASAGAVETLALVASVAVERLVNLTAQSLGALRPGDDEAVEWGDRITSFLEQSDCPERPKKRLTKLLGLLKQPRVIDRLHFLAHQGAVTGDCVNTWDRVRNAVAHGSFNSLGTPEQILYQCEEVVALAYQLVFRAVGYEGRYVHFGQNGWSLASYPRVATDR